MTRLSTSWNFLRSTTAWPACCGACPTAIPRRMRCASRASSRCWSRLRRCWGRCSRTPPPTTCGCRSCSAARDLAAAPGGDQELAVAVGAGDRAVGDADHAPTGLTAEPRDDAGANPAVQVGIADDAAFADLAGADLELRLDERDELRDGRCKRERCRQHDLEADEAGIADDPIDGVRDVPAREMARIGALEDDDAGVLAQLPGQLPVADVDGVDLGGAPGQQHVSKAAGRGADVEPDAAARIDGEMIEGVGELEAAAGDPRMILAAQFERLIAS